MKPRKIHSDNSILWLIIATIIGLAIAFWVSSQPDINEIIKEDARKSRTPIPIYTPTPTPTNVPRGYQIT